ncbi:MAG: hypothetical protein WAV78_16695, partial [Xanthobacteraceae bacterium]
MLVPGAVTVEAVTIPVVTSMVIVPVRAQELQGNPVATNGADTSKVVKVSACAGDRKHNGASAPTASSFNFMIPSNRPPSPQHTVHAEVPSV